MVDITDMPKKRRKMILWVVGLGIIFFWTLVTVMFEVIGLGQSTEVYSAAPLVRYMSAVGVVAIHYITWEIARSGDIKAPIDPRTGLIILIWIIALLHAVFTAMGPVSVPPHELPTSPYQFIDWITIPAIFFAGMVLNEKENRS
ncbi:hypothetical protein [Natranaeroarchaeum sulfidigenes]|uniref:hypothetical protein n=1 Tax=Natranaeroarchaeum sulfidigenes TaxID=2784880 RepID=UPI001EE5B364|nr:hypothetical protein [Natranaeroarchaeum sulfidigenes]